MKTVDEMYKERYQTVAPPLLAISKQTQKHLQRIFKDMGYAQKQTGLLIGRRIEARHLTDREGRYFSRNRLPSEKKSLAVAVLMDESGSMGGQDRITYARAAGIIIYDYCKTMQIPVLIMGHTDDGEVQLYAYTDFDSVDEDDRYRLMDMSARSGNRDGAALRYVAERLMKQPEEKKLLMLVSDGQPAGSGAYFGSEAEADLRGIKKEYTNKGILFMAAAIGDDKQNIERIYGDAFLDITDLTKLPLLLVRKIEKELRG
jgi:nitric oxide reductase activation protein